MKEITLNNVSKTQVDDEDYEWLNKWKWHQRPDGYAVRSENNRKIRMHREIMHAPIGTQVDHIDLNPLNNQKSNLRFATSGQNKFNSFGRSTRKCKYKGVSKSPPGCTKPYRASIQYKYKAYFLGVFNTEEEAALAYNDAAIKYFGQFAHLNDVGEQPHGYEPYLENEEKKREAAFKAWETRRTYQD